MTTKSFNIDDGVLNKLMALYPGATFTNVMLDLIENKINSTKASTDDNLDKRFEDIEDAIEILSDRISTIEEMANM